MGSLSISNRRALCTIMFSGKDKACSLGWVLTEHILAVNGALAVSINSRDEESHC